MLPITGYLFLIFKDVLCFCFTCRMRREDLACSKKNYYFPTFENAKWLIDSKIVEYEKTFKTLRNIAKIEMKGTDGCLLKQGLCVDQLKDDEQKPKKKDCSSLFLWAKLFFESSYTTVFSKATSKILKDCGSKQSLIMVILNDIPELCTLIEDTKKTEEGRNILVELIESTSL